MSAIVEGLKMYVSPITPCWVVNASGEMGSPLIKPLSYGSAPWFFDLHQVYRSNKLCFVLSVWSPRTEYWSLIPPALPNLEKLLMPVPDCELTVGAAQYGKAIRF